MNNLLNFAKGATDTSKIRIMAIKDGNPYIVKERPSSEPLSVCVAHNLAEQKLFPTDGVVLFVPDLADAMALFEI